MANGTITYDYPKIEQGIAELRGVNRSVESLIEKLAAETGQALDSWTGTASQQYDALAERVRGNFADMNTIVNDLANTLEQIAEDMKEQDRRSASGY